MQKLQAKHVFIFPVGNKNDVEEKRQISESEAKQICQSSDLEMPYYLEISAKENLGIQDVSIYSHSMKSLFV